ncbi:MAG: triosephosphate isomerase [Spirochaetaceae bacterium]|nr:MAG: triosephosphate isomerase [Spirochaetaceae bacterium]
MYEFGVNLKRFEVPQSLGGICTSDDPVGWIESVVRDCVSSGLGAMPNVRVRLFPPESLLACALRTLSDCAEEERAGFSIGSQVVYRGDIEKGGNFGAFTANLPAASVLALGAASALIGHSEERYDKYSLLAAYDPSITDTASARVRANSVVNRVIGEEMSRASARELSIMLCVGETAEEKGQGTEAEQSDRVREVLSDQLTSALSDETVHGSDIVIAYEPRWAIGPGRVPADAGYIAGISRTIKEITLGLIGRELPVVYGGGLKRENAAEVASVGTIDGGLVALTKFTPPIAFDPHELKAIIGLFLDAKARL